MSINLRYQPAAPLSHFVRTIWYYEGYTQPHAMERLMPDGYMCLIVNLDEDRIRIYDRDDPSRFSHRSGVIAMGARPEYFLIDTAQQRCVPGVQFRAGSASVAEVVSQTGFTAASESRTAVGDFYNPARRAAGHNGLMPDYKPEGYQSLTPYLVVPDAERIRQFLKEAFGAEELSITRRPDGTIQHSEFRIGDSMVELGQAHGTSAPKQAGLHLYVPDTDAVYRKAIEAGAESLQEPNDAPYGDRAAGVADPAGNNWWLATFKFR